MHFAPPVAKAERAGLLSCGKPKHRRRYVIRAHKKSGQPPVDCPECLASKEYQQALWEETAEAEAATAGAPPWYVCSACPHFEASELSEWRAHRTFNRGHKLSALSRVPRELQELEECQKAEATTQAPSPIARVAVEESPQVQGLAREEPQGQEAPAAEPKPLPWMDLRIFVVHKGARVTLGLTPYGADTPPPAIDRFRVLLPVEIRCDGCELRLPYFDSLSQPGEKHEECPKGGTWRGAFRFMVDPERRVYLVDGTRRARPIHPRGEAVSHAAIEAGGLVDSLEELAEDARRQGLPDTAAVYDGMARAVRPHAQLLDRIADHLGSIGRGLPAPLSEYLTAYVEQGTASLEGEPPASKVSVLGAAGRLGVPAEELERIGEAVKDAGGAGGALWRVQEDAQRLAQSAQRAAQALAIHPRALSAYIPERLGIFAAQMRQSARLAGMARHLVMLEPGEEVPPEILALLSWDEAAAPTAEEEQRCSKCAASLTADHGPADGLPDSPPLVCSPCQKVESECTCSPAELNRLRLDLALQLDAAIVQASALSRSLARVRAAAEMALEGDEERRSLDVASARIERLEYLLSRVALRLENGRGTGDVDEVAPRTLPGALREVEEAAAELGRASLAAQSLVDPESDAYAGESVREVLRAQAARAELEACAAAVLRMVAAVEPGAPIPPEYSEAEARIVTATRSGRAPMGFAEAGNSGKGAELAEQAGPPPPEDPDLLQLELEAEQCKLEGWSPGEGRWWAEWHGGMETVRVWFSAPTGAELLAQVRWLNAQLSAARGGQ